MKLASWLLEKNENKLWLKFLQNSVTVFVNMFSLFLKIRIRSNKCLLIDQHSKKKKKEAKNEGDMKIVQSTANGSLFTFEFYGLRSGHDYMICSVVHWICWMRNPSSFEKTLPKILIWWLYLSDVIMWVLVVKGIDFNTWRRVRCT